ncbi:head GIN domain-containing protein [Lutibacter holmesii]|uniref:Head GIN domain-containing protein n=1 Tax=Lutibacter holmesii TaxID=1137985 RepID=A0ABW3WKT9_9FLAO
MKKLALLLLFTSALAFGQETIETNLGDFNTLKIFSGLKVELIKSDVSKVVITGSKASQVSIKNKNGILKFSIKFIEGFKYDDVAIKLYYTNIPTLDANEGSHIFSNEVIKQQHLELKTQEGATINAALDVKYLTVKTVSGGIIEVSGTVDNQTIEGNTGGIYEGFEVESTHTTAVSSAGSVVEVNVSEMLDAKVNFGGTIYYKGNPEELKTKKVIGGKIESK